MHILIISAVFPPEPVTSSITSEHIAIGLVKAGHQVTVITGYPSRPSPDMFSDNLASYSTRERNKDGVYVIRVKSYKSKKSTAMVRLLENISFGINSLLKTIPVKPDVVYSNSWPIFATGMISLWCSMKHIPIIVSVQDIHPESPIQLGKLPPHGMITDIMRAIDTRISQKAAALVAISENFAEFYRTVRKVDPSNIHMIPNWLDADEITPSDRENAFRTKYSFDPKEFIVMYVGNIGSVAGVEIMVEVANILRQTPYLQFVIVGDGSGRDECKSLAKKYQLSNVQFIGSIPREELSNAQAIADVLVLPTRPGGAMNSVPSKLISYMMAQRAILAAVDKQSDTARIINAVGCGSCVEPGDSNAMAAQILNWQQSKDTLHTMGIKGREYAIEQFSRQICVPKIVKIIENVHR